MGDVPNTLADLVIPIYKTAGQATAIATAKVN